MWLTLLHAHAQYRICTWTWPFSVSVNIRISKPLWFCIVLVHRIVITSAAALWMLDSTRRKETVAQRAVSWNGARPLVWLCIGGFYVHTEQQPANKIPCFHKFIFFHKRCCGPPKTVAVGQKMFWWIALFNSKIEFRSTFLGKVRFLAFYWAVKLPRGSAHSKVSAWA